MFGAVAFALFLLWEGDAAWPRRPDAFLLTTIMASSGTPEELRTPASAPGACVDLPTGQAESYCTQWPTCPPAGEILFFWVVAAWGEQHSAQSDGLACHIDAACTCVVVPMTAEEQEKHRPSEQPYTPPVLPPVPPFLPQFPPAPV